MLATDPTEIVIKKMDRRLVLSMMDGSERVYPVALGKNWAADKAIEGDHATPLGEFYVCAKNPRSKYFRSLCISYPNAEDAERGLNAGLITAAEHAQIIEAIGLGAVPPQHTRLGGEIYIHGQRGMSRQPGMSIADAAKDWTRGCIALDDADMRELYDLIAIGTRVVIVD